MSDRPNNMELQPPLPSPAGEQDRLLDLWRQSGDAGMDMETVMEEYRILADRLGIGGTEEGAAGPCSGNAGNGGRGGRRKVLAGLFRYAAILALPLCIAGAGIAMLLQSREKAEALAETGFIQEATGYGEKKDFYLPDSTRVWLNSGSVLIYPEKFIGNRRNVFLSGEGYFQVTEDRRRPFSVRTDNISVKVHGTAFNLSSYADDSAVKTTLESGSVEIAVPGKEKTFTLVPDEQLTYNTGSDEVKIEKVSSSDFSTWRDGGITIDDRSLEETALMLEKMFNVRIIVATERFAGARLNIRFRSGETIGNVLHIIQGILPGMRIDTSGNVIIIR